MPNPERPVDALTIEAIRQTQDAMNRANFTVEWQNARPIPPPDAPALPADGPPPPWWDAPEQQQPPVPTTPPETRTRRRAQPATGQVPPPTRGDTLTYQRIAPLEAPRTREPRAPVIESIELIDVQNIGHRLVVTARFMHDGVPDNLAFEFYADTGRTLMPFATALSERLATQIRAIQGLPEPPRQQVPNLTVGERLFNMTNLLMDGAVPNEVMQSEWNALRTEYERAVGGGPF